MPSQVFAQGLLDGQVVVVTGGGSGLGRATAVELAALGAQVVIAGRRQEPLDETAALCDGGRCRGFVCDIREEEQVEAFVDRVLEEHGRIDTLVNNAGGQYMTPAEDISLKGFETVVRLNLVGTWLMSHAAATKSMIPNEGGKIISVTLSPHHGLPGMAHSSAARAVRSASGASACGRNTGWRSRKNASLSVTRSSAPPPATLRTASPRHTWTSEKVRPSIVMPSHASTSRSASAASRSGSGRPVSHQASSRRSAGRSAA